VERERERGRESSTHFEASIDAPRNETRAWYVLGILLDGCVCVQNGRCFSQDMYCQVCVILIEFKRHSLCSQQNLATIQMACSRCQHKRRVAVVRAAVYSSTSWHKMLHLQRERHTNTHTHTDGQLVQNSSAILRDHAHHSWCLTHSKRSVTMNVSICTHAHNGQIQ
jgi:hypothetical protein